VRPLSKRTRGREGCYALLFILAGIAQKSVMIEDTQSKLTQTSTLQENQA